MGSGESMPHPGDVLGDRYRLDDRLAAGGMGEVWRATDTVLGRGVAVKTLHTDRAGDPGFQTRFRHEARAMAVLHHPGVADVYDYGQAGPDAYIVMAHVQGEALNQRIAERGRLTPAETMSIVTQAGRALEAAHQAGIVHRDVKPGNLIIQPDGTVVLVDFGVARSAESAALTGAKEVVGTALYIAPEQVSKEVTGPAADIYALGVVAYHCLAGHPPFMGDSPIAVAVQHVSDEAPPLPEDVPPSVRTLVTTAMAKDPAERFSSAAVMAGAAERAIAGGLNDTTALLAAPGAGAGAFAAGRATAGPQTNGPQTNGPRATGTNTQILPPVPGDDEPEPGAGGGAGGRKRGLLLAAMAAVVLGTVAAILLAVNPGILPGSSPADSATKPAVDAPSTKVTPTKSGKRSSTTSTRAPANGTTPTTAPTEAATPKPSHTPTGGTATTTAPADDATTGAPATEETTTSTSGDDNSGDEGGNGGGAAEAATTAGATTAAAANG